MSAYLRWREEFAKAIDPRLYTIEHLDDLIYSRRAQFFHCPEAAIVTEVKVYPTGANVIHGLVAAGELSEIIDRLIPGAEDWGREHGCVMAIIESREGWSKALKAHGWAPFQTAIVKDL
jgi:hypothetical protein